MALIVKAANDINAGIRANLGTTDDLFIAAGVTVSRTDSNTAADVAVLASGSNHIIDIQGSVVNLGHAIQIGDNAAADAGSSLHLASSAYVATFGSEAAITFQSRDSTLINDGIIFAFDGDGIRLSGNGASRTTIQNFGRIEAENGIVAGDAMEHVDLINSGEIIGYEFSYQGGQWSDQIINNGVMAGMITLGIGNFQDMYDGRNGRLIPGSSGYVVVYGNGGDDTLLGGIDGDRLHGGDGNDYMAGGAGNDEYWVDQTGDQTVELANKGNDTVRSDISWTLSANIENLILDSPGNFRATGNTLANILTGNSGHNLMFGLAGNDKLFGDGGDDQLRGGTGADRLTGGIDADRFIFNSIADSRTANGIDKIIDFKRIEGDKIQLNGIDANTTQAGNQAFTFIGKSAFSGVAGQLRYHKTANGTDSIITADVNGDGTADFTVMSDVAWNFISGDFIL